MAGLLVPTESAGNVMVPSKGWYIFGGHENNSKSSQHLTSVDGVWESGPKFFQSKPDSGNCVVQVKPLK